MSKPKCESVKNQGGDYLVWHRVELFLIYLVSLYNIVIIGIIRMKLAKYILLFLLAPYIWAFDLESDFIGTWQIEGDFPFKSYIIYHPPHTYRKPIEFNIEGKVLRQMKSYIPYRTYRKHVLALFGIHQSS